MFDSALYKLLDKMSDTQGWKLGSERLVGVATNHEHNHIYIIGYRWEFMPMVWVPAWHAESNLTRILRALCFCVNKSVLENYRAI